MTFEMWLWIALALTLSAWVLLGSLILEEVRP